MAALRLVQAQIERAVTRRQASGGGYQDLSTNHANHKNTPGPERPSQRAPANIGTAEDAEGRGTAPALSLLFPRPSALSASSVVEKD
jgi:hypothetical protein